MEVANMIGSFASGATASLVAKNGTKKIILLQWLQSFKKPQIKKYLNDHIDLPDMIGSFVSGATNSLVAKNGTKKIISLQWRDFGV